MQLVVGATGSLGAEVCRQLVATGARVRALVRPTADPGRVRELRGLGVQLVEGDLRDTASLAVACTGVAGVVALGLLAFFLIRRRQDNSFFRRAAELEEEHKVASTVEPFTLGGGGGLGHHPSFSAAGGYGVGGGYGAGSPPTSPHAGVPLLDRDAGPLPQLPPSYE